jgi:hypothetical protein
MLERVGLRLHPHLCSIVILTACASGQAPTPEVTITQTSRVETIRAANQTAVPVEFHLEITNPLNHAVTLVGVEIETVGESGGYVMQRVRHKFTKEIAAHAKESIDLRAWVRPTQETDTGRIVTAVMIRGTARFESMGSTIQSAFTGRLAQ